MKDGSNHKEEMNRKGIILLVVSWITASVRIARIFHNLRSSRQPIVCNFGLHSVNQRHTFFNCAQRHLPEDFY
jgi:hypothetical protein